MDSHRLETAALLALLGMMTSTGIGLARTAASNRRTTRNVGTRPKKALNTRKVSGDQLREEFSFLLRDLKVDHQSEINNLNITVRYEYIVGTPDGSYPDFRLLARDIENYLAHYPNKVDYWEILNKKLAALLLAKYGALRSVTIEIQVSPTGQDPYLRASTVTRERSAAGRRAQQ